MMFLANLPLWLSAVLIVGVPTLLAMLGPLVVRRFRAQAIIAAALASLIFSGLLVIVAIDHPFAGLAKVEPDALSLVLEDLGRVDKADSLPPRRQ